MLPNTVKLAEGWVRKRSGGVVATQSGVEVPEASRQVGVLAAPCGNAECD